MTLEILANRFTNEYRRTNLFIRSSRENPIRELRSRANAPSAFLKLTNTVLCLNCLSHFLPPFYT